jgi:hypothetical protein
MAVDLTISNHGIQLEGLLRMILAVVKVAAKDIVIRYGEYCCYYCCCCYYYY